MKNKRPPKHPWIKQAKWQEIQENKQTNKKEIKGVTQAHPHVHTPNALC